MRKLILAVTIALSLAGCGHIGDVFKLATASIDNPISGVDIYRVKNTYAAALEIAAEYRRYCWSASYRILMADPIAKQLCANRRQVVRQIQTADVKANAAIGAAETFVANNPTISAVTIIGAAWDAVTAFKTSIPAK